MIDLNFVKDFNDLIKNNQHTIVCAESITAGLIASTIASVSGASEILKGSIVTYNAELKKQLLGVPNDIIEEYTAESQETTDAMLLGLKRVYPNATIHVAVTGVASPPSMGYRVNKEVGQIYVSMSINGKDYKYDTIITPIHKKDERNEIRRTTVKYILEKILENLG